MPNTDNLTEQISVLRTETNPDGITPEALGKVLQAIVDFIAALGLIDISEEADLAARVTAAESAANAAETKATTALANAAKNVIDSITATPAAGKVTISVKQHGHSADTVDVPAATQSEAGVMSAADKQSLTQALLDIVANAITGMQVTTTTTTATLKVSKGTGYVQVTFPIATTSKAGLMSKADKVLLDGLPAAASIALLDESGHLRGAHAPVVMLDEMDGNPLDNAVAGSTFYDIDTHHICYFIDNGSNYVDLGAPSQNVCYCNKKTNVLYRWTGSAFEPINGNPLAGLITQQVRVTGSSAKRYNIPAGVLCILHPTTDTANFVLLSGADGNADVHRIVIEASDLGPLVDGTNTGLKWPSGLVWNTANGAGPTVQDVDNGEAILVTIYNQRYADFIAYR